MSGKGASLKARDFVTIAVSIFFIAALLLGQPARAEEQAQEQAQKQPPFTTYQIKVALDDTRHTLAGTEIVTYTNRADEALRELYFNLPANADRERNPYIYNLWNDAGYPNGFDPGWTKVSRVALLGEAGAGTPVSFALEPVQRAVQTYSRADALLRVPLPEPLAPGEAVRLAIDFESKFPERRSEPAVFNGLYVWRFGWFPAERAREQGRWNDGMEFAPGFFDVELTVPGDFAIASGADVQEEIVDDGATKTYRLIGSRAGRISLSLAMGRQLAVLEGEAEGVPILVYYQYGSAKMAAKVLAMAENILADYSRHFGPYLYGRLVITENSTLGAGMAVDGLVTLTESVWRTWDSSSDAVTNRTLEWFLAHEIGHQWWGIGVREDMLDENWLSEAFAEYLAHSYMDRKYEKDGARLVDPDNNRPDAALLRALTGNPPLRELMEERVYLGAVQTGVDEAPVKRIEDYRFLNSYATTIYNKGFLILRGAEGIVGRERMETALRGFFERHGGGDAIDVATFVKEVSTSTGLDLDPYFAQWLFRDGNVDFAVDGFAARQEDGRWLTTVRVRNNGPFRMPASVEVTTADGTKETATWDGKAATGEVAFNTTGRVVRAAIDAERFAPDVNRGNNFYPRKIKWAFFDANPLDAYVMRVSPGAVVVRQPGLSAPSAQLGLGLGGRYRDDWSWDVYATLEPGGTWTKYDLQLVKGAQGTLRLGSSATGFGWARLDGQNRLSAEVGTDFALWTPVNVGMAGGYLERGVSGRVAGGREVAPDGAPRYYGRAEVARDLTTKLGWTGSAGVKAATDGSVVVDGTATGYVGVAKNLIAAVSLAGGQVVACQAPAADLPRYSFRGYGDDASAAAGASGGLSGSVPVGAVGSGGAAFASVDLNYPLARNLNLKAADGFVLDGLEARVFGEAGSGWSSQLSGINWSTVENGLKADVGVELVLGVTLDGSVPLGFRFGYAHRVTGEDIRRFGRFYFDVGLWLDRMIMGI